VLLQTAYRHGIKNDGSGIHQWIYISSRELLSFSIVEFIFNEFDDVQVQVQVCEIWAGNNY